jgi:hypothetical protein
LKLFGAPKVVADAAAILFQINTVMPKAKILDDWPQHFQVGKGSLNLCYNRLEESWPLLMSRLLRV